MFCTQVLMWHHGQMISLYRKLHHRTPGRPMLCKHSCWHRKYPLHGGDASLAILMRRQSKCPENLQHGTTYNKWRSDRDVTSLQKGMAGFCTFTGAPYSTKWVRSHALLGKWKFTLLTSSLPQPFCRIILCWLIGGIEWFLGWCTVWSMHFVRI